MKNDTIIVVLSFARSGGTILNRCMAVLPNVVMFSEVSAEAICPNSCDTINEQAKRWYELDIKEHNFIDSVKKIHQYCLKNNKKLIIRDWVFGSFVPSRHNNFEPSKSLYTLSKLSEHFPLKVFTFIRHPLDVWLSMYYSKSPFYDYKLEYLFEFIKEVNKANIKPFFYEDFCKHPIREMKKICDYCDLFFDDNFLIKYKEFYNVCGDIDSKEKSRGVKQCEIGQLARLDISNELVNFINRKTKKNEIEIIFNSLKSI